MADDPTFTGVRAPKKKCSGRHNLCPNERDDGMDEFDMKMKMILSISPASHMMQTLALHL